MDIFNNFLRNIKDFGEKITSSTTNSIKKQINNIETQGDSEFFIRSNGGSFVTLNTNNKYKNLDAQADVCIGNNKVNIGLNLKPSDEFLPHTMAYINILNTLFMGYNYSLHSYLSGEFKEVLYSNASSEFLSHKQDNEMSVIMSIGDSSDMMYQVGMKKNSGLVLGMNYLIGTNDMLILQYDKDLILYANLYGAYVSFVNELKIGVNITRLLSNISHQNISLYNFVIGYGSDGIFSMLMIKVLISVLGLYLVVQILYEKGVKISLRLQQASINLCPLNKTMLKESYLSRLM